jgi:hypothetical protein
MAEKEIFTTVKPELVIGQLFQSRDTIHIAHLQTVNYAEHKALNKYYDSLLDLTDDLLETYFGTIGKRINIKIPASEYVNPQQHLKQLMEYVKKHRGVFGLENTHIQNIVDEILALIAKTLYLLTLS